MNICFQGIRIVNPAQSLDIVSNLWIKDGIIKDISENCQCESETQIINAKGLTALPGLFDMHVHFREPGFEYKEDLQSGMNAAANGGFTGVLIMPNTNPPIHDKTVVEYIKSKVKGNLVDVFISGTITQNQDGNHISNMLELNENGVVLFTDDGRSVLSSDVMKRALEYAAPLDLLISQHCEDHTLTNNFDMNESEMSIKLGLKGYPSVAEEIILFRDIALAEYCGNRRYHAQHISTKGAVDLIRNAKSKGLRVTCEVTPHHFSLDDMEIASYDSNYKMNPPLRTKKDIEAIIEGLIDGTIDVIATDHAPHSKLEKDVEFDKAPNGITGLETSFAVCYTHLVQTKLLSLEQLIEKLSINPRKILNQQPIEINKDKMANLTIVDCNEEWIVHSSNFMSKSTNSPYINQKFIGKVKYAINNSKIHQSIL